MDAPAPDADLRRENDALRLEVERCRRAAREIDHRAANSLQIAAAALGMQLRRVAGEEARAVIEAARLRLGAIAHAHRYFYSHGIAHEVDVAAILGELAQDLSLGMGLDCRSEMGRSMVPAEQATQLLILVNELVVNAHKHGHGGAGDGIVLISGGQSTDGSVRLVVSDDGAGLPDGFDAGGKKGLGMQLIRATVGQLGGTMRAWTDGGAHFAVTIPAIAPRRSAQA